MAHIRSGVEAQLGGEVEVLARAADVEAGGDGRGVLVDDEGDGADAAAVGELGLDLDGDGALVERAEGGGEDDRVAGGLDGAAGEYSGADLVPCLAGLRLWCAGEARKAQGGSNGEHRDGAAHEAIPRSSMRGEYAFPRELPQWPDHRA
jgi:hypothetical protein